ncbi:MAG: hypothetical protein IPH96_02220 [Saprospiraceae bacterium]|nr:hypothetical protein [Saprospiraceae bacterium]
MIELEVSLVHVGVDANGLVQVGSDVSTNGQEGNNLKSVFEFQDSISSSAYEPVYFKNW